MVGGLAVVGNRQMVVAVPGRWPAVQSGWTWLAANNKIALAVVLRFAETKQGGTSAAVNTPWLDARARGLAVHAKLLVLHIQLLGVKIPVAGR